MTEKHKLDSSDVEAQQLEFPAQPSTTLAEPLENSQGPTALIVGQRVYCSAFGFGTIVAFDIEGVTVRFAATEENVKAQELVTLAQAEWDWRAHWLPGAKRRREEGRRLWIIKGLCTYGEWSAFLAKYDLSRGTCDDLIRTYKNEIMWEAQTQQMIGNQAIDQTKLELDRSVNPQAPDPEANRRREKVEEENQKRIGRQATYHKSLWSIRIKLPAKIIVLCRTKYRELGSKEYWRRAAYAFIGLDPDAPTSPDTTPAPAVATTTIEEVRANLGAEEDDVVADVIDLLRTEGRSAADIQRVHFNHGLNFNDTLRLALQQLEPTDVKKGL